MFYITWLFFIQMLKKVCFFLFWWDTSYFLLTNFIVFVRSNFIHTMNFCKYVFLFLLMISNRDGFVKLLIFKIILYQIKIIKIKIKNLIWTICFKKSIYLIWLFFKQGRIHSHPSCVRVRGEVEKVNRAFGRERWAEKAQLRRKSKKLHKQ